MRSYLRETIREEVRRELREEPRRDGPGPPRAQLDGQGDERRAEAQAEFRVVLRPIASSLPLGFFAFTVGTILLTAIELN
jgi:hypothetical protein